MENYRRKLRLGGNEGGGITDYETLSRIIDRYQPNSILDIGCGYGRLFRLYQDKNIDDVVGVDISEKALRFARMHFPKYKVIRTRLEDMDIRTQMSGIRAKVSGEFDMAINTRVLQHILPGSIEAVIRKICSLTDLVYINELTETDGCVQTQYIFKHNYLSLFESNGFVLKERGMIARQSYFVFSKSNECL